MREIVLVKGMPGKGKTYYAVYKLLHSRKRKRAKNLITNLKIDGFECIHPENLSVKDLDVLSQEGYGVLLDDFKVVSIDRGLLWELMNGAVIFYVVTSWEEDIPETIFYSATRIVTPLGKKKAGECVKLGYKEEIRTPIKTYARYVALPVLDDVFDRILDDHGITREERRRLRESGVIQ